MRQLTRHACRKATREARGDPPARLVDHLKTADMVPGMAKETERRATVGPSTAELMIAAILFGVDRTVGERHLFMARFDEISFMQPLSDQQITSISTCVAPQFGYPGLKMATAAVAIPGAGGPASPLAVVSTYAVPTLVIVGLIIIALWEFPVTHSLHRFGGHPE